MLSLAHHRCHGSARGLESCDGCDNCLSHSFAHAGSPGIAAYDEKNIRRRVYDALNVLMAMDIIIKDKKDISWKGLPSAPHAQLEKLREERAALRQKILNQQVYLQVCVCSSCGLTASRIGFMIDLRSSAAMPPGALLQCTFLPPCQGEALNAQLR